jgi:hypothetical protein
MSFHVSFVIHEAFACLSMWGACSLMHHFNLSYLSLTVSGIDACCFCMGNVQQALRYRTCSNFGADCNPPVTIM